LVSGSGFITAICQAVPTWFCHVTESSFLFTDAFGICIDAALERLFQEAMRTIGERNEKAIVNETAKIVLHYVG
jgi:hypothetical protein